MERNPLQKAKARLQDLVVVNIGITLVFFLIGMMFLLQGRDMVITPATIFWCCATITAYLILITLTLLSHHQMMESAEHIFSSVDMERAGNKVVGDLMRRFCKAPRGREFVETHRLQDDLLKLCGIKKLPLERYCSLRSK